MQREGNATPGAVAGVDIGGTLIKAVLLGPDDQVCGQSQMPTPAAGRADLVMDAVVAMVGELAAALPPGVQVAALGVAVPGAVDAQRGVVVEATNLAWRNVDLAASLASRVGLPVFIEHDVRSAALAELVFGQGGDLRDFLFVTIGTGIGAAVVVEGRIYAGANRLAGEIGHVVVAPDGPFCACGKQGCLEAIASASALVRRGRAAGLPEELTGEQLAALVAAGDPPAVRVWREATDAVGLALANYAMVMDPLRIILGGGLAEAGELLLGPVRTAMARHLNAAYSVTVTASALGAAAGRLGAAALARLRLKEEG